MKSLDHARYIQCGFSAWFMAGLSGFWTILIGMAWTWFAARSTGWLQSFSLLISVSALTVHVVSMSRELRAARRLEPRMMFLCLSCSTEFYRFTQEQAQRIPQGSSRQEQLAAIPALQDNALARLWPGWCALIVGRQ